MLCVRLFICQMIRRIINQDVARGNIVGVIVVVISIIGIVVSVGVVVVSVIVEKVQ